MTSEWEHRQLFNELARIRHEQIREARETRDERVANIVEVIIRQAAKGNAMDGAYYVPVIVENVETTSLTDEQRTWLVLADEDEEDE